MSQDESPRSLIYQPLMVVDPDSTLAHLPWERAVAAWCDQLTTGTRRNYRPTVCQFFETPGMVSTLEAVRAQHLREWRGTLMQRTQLPPGHSHRISAATANRHIAALRAFFAYWRKLSPEEAPHVRFSRDQQDAALEHLRGHQRRPYQVLAPAEVAPLLTAAVTPQALETTPYPQRVTRPQAWRRVYRGKDAQYAQRDLVLITVALATGLRAAELADLNVGDLYEMSGTWWLDVRHGKGNKRRRVEIAAEDAALIIDYITNTKRNFAAAADRSLPLWLSRRTRRDAGQECRLTANHIRRIIDSIADLAQARGELAPGKRISPHALRHTYAINLLKGDPTEGRRPATIVEVQFRLGHTDLAATKRYVEHLAEEDMIGLVPRITRQIQSLSIRTFTNEDDAAK